METNAPNPEDPTLPRAAGAGIDAKHADYQRLIDFASAISYQRLTLSELRWLYFGGVPRLLILGAFLLIWCGLIALFNLPLPQPRRVPWLFALVPELRWCLINIAAFLPFLYHDENMMATV
jgi:hypothetical protein